MRKIAGSNLRNNCFPTALAESNFEPLIKTESVNLPWGEVTVTNSPAKFLLK
jgi:hypothetical protein